MKDDVWGIFMIYGERVPFFHVFNHKIPIICGEGIGNCFDLSLVFVVIFHHIPYDCSKLIWGACRKVRAADEVHEVA